MSELNQHRITRFQTLFRSHANWSDETFGDPEHRGAEGPLKHLAKEALEATAKPDDIEEYADCTLLLMDSVRRAGFNFDQLLDAIEHKLAKNIAREWSRTPGDNTEAVEHKREVPQLMHAEGSLDPNRKLNKAVEVQADQILSQRRAQYGKTPFTQETDAQIFHGLLERHWQIKLPSLAPYMIPLLMTAIKLARAAAPTPINDDDYVDGVNYLKLAKECRS